MAHLSETPEFFSMQDGYGHFRLDGEYTFNEAVARIDAAIAYCRANSINRLLVDIRELTGFPPPTITQRFEFATRWSDSSGGRVALSVIAPERLIDRDKIGMTMATNRGPQSNVTTDESEAIAWLTAARP